MYFRILVNNRPSVVEHAPDVCQLLQYVPLQDGNKKLTALSDNIYVLEFLRIHTALTNRICKLLRLPTIVNINQIVTQ